MISAGEETEAYLAGRAAAFLVALAESFGRDDLLAALRTHHEGLLAILVGTEGLQKAINHLADNQADVLLFREAHEHNVMHLNAGMTWALVLDAVGADRSRLGGLAFGEFDRSLRAAIAEAARLLLLTSEAQVKPLVATVNRIADIVEPMARAGGADVVLVELPIGNSIPIRLIEAALDRRGIGWRTLWGAINRNDSAARGVTRKDVLDSEFRRLGIDGGTLIVYVDEWVSGSNFATMCDLLSRLAKPSRATFIPAAFVAHGAQSHENFPRLSKKHDALAERVGFRGDDLRFSVPSLNDGVDDGRPFFWAEHDRLAGYRKMQVFGSMFSSTVAAVRRLAEDDVKLREAHALWMVEIAKSADTTESDLALALRHYQQFAEVFHESSTEIDDWEAGITGTSLPSNTDPRVDIEVAAREVATLIDESSKEHRARFSIGIATLWMKRRAVDADDRFHFRGHLPMLCRLEGDLALLSELVIGGLANRL